ncbi:MAG: biopolymer transporter ExbD [Acidobacteriota bacterium]|nr:biopolymer transporter ExbD [Acidobacteriota bacterium]
MNSQQENRQGRPAKPHINVTPLIDVLLVLLIIFMVISPLRPARFKALVPDEPPDDPRVMPHVDTLVVTINRERTLMLNQTENLGSVDDTSKLAAELSRVLRVREENNVVRDFLIETPGLSQAERIEKTVFIRAPRSLNYGAVAQVIDAVKGAGANPVGLQIDNLE